jgi:hypothetical protein
MMTKRLVDTPLSTESEEFLGALKPQAVSGQGQAARPVNEKIRREK